MEQTLNTKKLDCHTRANDRLELLRQRINDETYLYAAIQRLALIMSNELMEISKEGGRYERQRRK
jgi:hypothetical protein